MAVLIDTHAHLQDRQFAGDRADVLQRARQAGVGTIIAVGITAKCSQECVELAGREPGIVATVGIHPNEIPAAGPADWQHIEELCTHPRVVGIGETGLDRYWDKTPIVTQIDWFERHLELARRRDLPTVIHCRDAEADVLEVLRRAFDRWGPIRAVMHSFTGSQQTAEACLALGLHLSFAGMLTYKNAEAIRAVARTVPLERLLVETDCPYLAPVPLRGKRNEPAHLQHTARLLGELHGLDLAAMAAVTTDNARQIFRIVSDV